MTVRPRLAAGARVALVAPAGPLRGPEELERAAHNVESLGWRPVVAAHALARAGYFAGPDRERAADFQRVLDDESLDAIWCLRGGYGAMRILEGLDWSTFRRRPRALIGFSDITALHLAAWRECGRVTFHGPTARQRLGEFSRASLARALSGGDPLGDAPAARVLRPGEASGRLAGGNLALLAAMVGTRWAPSFDGAVVVLEDVNEPTYRVDRLLTQLRLAGTLDGVRAIAFGHCTNCEEEADGGGRRTLDEILAELGDRLAVPCVSGIPVGHVDEQWTIPLGVTARLGAGPDGVSLRVQPAGAGP